MSRKKKRRGAPKCAAETGKGPCVRPPGHDGAHLQPPADFPPRPTRHVAPGAPFVTRKREPPAPPYQPSGPGPTIDQLNTIQRLRDQTGVLTERPLDRDQADRQIAALVAYLTDDVRA